jgi:microcystin-dependent protein
LLTLDNIQTQDDFVPSLTLEQPTADTLTYIIGNASVYAQFRSVSHRGEASAPWGASVLLPPSTNTVRNVAGVRFRSAVAGTPARVIAQLTSPQDPQIGAGTSFDRSIAASGAVGDVLTGTIFDYAGASPPTGYLLCDGSAILRADYAALFAVISITYGAGDGSTTFNVPDLRGRVAVGVGTHTTVDARGKSDPAGLAARSPVHRHTVGNDAPDHTHAIPDNVVAGALGGINSGSTNALSSFGTRVAPGGASARHSHAVGPGAGTEPLDTPSFLVLNKIIKT